MCWSNFVIWSLELPQLSFVMLSTMNEKLMFCPTAAPSHTSWTQKGCPALLSPAALHLELSHKGSWCFVDLLMDQLINFFNYLLIFEPFPGDGAALGEFMAAGVKGEFAQQSKAPCVVLLASRLLINHILIPSCLQHTVGIQGWDTGQSLSSFPRPMEPHCAILSLLMVN